ncbi:hypothetical protein TTHERM_001001529 (macronuclear) [Tetrahymena thermophila SB210]|uniref:Uncharacterized protein n=1 Tax=Tetrahymena thermophila (strain SB210) TaxID=312017 RepID=W7X3S1_TETTS|nr:hypothetical protein TTHERM_001001529 [Tetrahymena thermophila SB210]EWS71068.1 hypothetical protein TTHERM_001001529 [Tetrahymena thermophila SB210]|eukprot:XP_012656409.1 hypothetical protein TTHERM_001001529 [Tetrahymena thermophila SB210]
MLSQQYHNQQIYESVIDQKNAPQNIRNNQMSSYWNEYIPVKYNFLEYENDPKYIPGFDCKFKQTKPYYRQELTFMPIPRNQNSQSHRSQMIENQVKHDYQSKRFDIQLPKDWNDQMFGKKIEYNIQVDQQRQQALQQEIQKVCDIQNQQYNQLVLEGQANQPKTNQFKLTSQQHYECQQYSNGQIKQLPPRQQNNQQSQYNQLVSNIQQQQQLAEQQTNKQFYQQNEQQHFMNQSKINSQYQNIKLEDEYIQQPKGFVLNPLKYSQNLEQQHHQQYPQFSQGVNFNPLNNSERIFGQTQTQNESAFTFNKQSQVNIKPQQHYQTAYRFFPQETYIDQYLFESDLAKRRIHETRMMNRAISEEHLFFTSQSPRFRAPFHEAQGLESNSFYAKPNLYKHSTPIIN